ncbi:MAG: hypothetical protein KatS3mg036_0121 [Ignavibacterium sp.]|nr:MAG: hypothetical protein KatS3mg036_0121 [Ignavibacterium sp.]
MILIAVQTLFRTNDYNSWESIGIDETKNFLFIKGLIDTVYALSINDTLPKLKWKLALGYGLDTNPINISTKGERVFVPAKNGFLYVIEKESGKLLNSFFLGKVRLNEVIPITNSQVIVSNMDGKIFIINVN